MFKKFFFSFYTTLILFFFYALSCAVATFVENDFGTPVAKALVYNALWFDILHLLLLINLIGIIFVYKLFSNKKFPSLLLHCAFIVILIGAGITRYFGLEGGMHIREGESSNILVTRDEFIALMLYNDEGKVTQYRQFDVNFNPLFQNSFKQDVQIGDKIVNLELKKYNKAEDKDSSPIIEMSVSFNGDKKEILLVPNYSNANVIPFRLGGEIFALNWGPNEITLPFSLELKDFILERYAGSMSPSSYMSVIDVIDEENSFEYAIFMNNVLDYGGYRFFQSSYDQDELGTILSVNKDPGKIPTYIGYAMLIIGFLWVIFSKKSRFYKLSNYLKNQKHLLLIFALLLAFQSPSFAENNQTQAQVQDQFQTSTEIQNDEILDLVKKLKKSSKEHSNFFGSLLVQDFGGRIKPMDTLAMDFIHKITGKDGFFGLNYNQIFIGMIIYPDKFRKLKMIPVQTPRLREILGLSKNEKYIAFDDVLEGNFYKLENFVGEANRKKPALRDKFDKDVLAVDEKINSAFYVYSGEVFRVFPDPSGATNTWYTPSNELPFDEEGVKSVRNLLSGYFFSFNNGLESGDFSNANSALENIKKFQNYYGKELLISDTRVHLEIFLNHYKIFENLTFVYLILGILLFAIVFYEILQNKKSLALIKKGLYYLIALGVFFHTLALIFRWYVGDHAPWSNAYESMVYIAWTCGICGVIFFRKSFLALCTASILAGTSLFVAHLGSMDPQITNLVPVLKSYWLNIHVSIITASYGFLALCFLLGIFSLVLFILRSPKRMQIDQSLLNIHCISEMAMILGLALLTIGNFLGGVWANESWGRYWGWDSKETWALISIVVYAFVLHLRFIPRFNNPYTFSSASVIAFYSILMTYFGVNFYLSGLHSYAAGDPVPIPIFLYFLVAFTLLLIVAAFFKKDLKSPI